MVWLLHMLLLGIVRHSLCQVNEPYFGGDWTKLACKAYESGVHMSEDWWRNLYSQCVLVLAFQVNSCTVLTIPTFVEGPESPDVSR